MNAQRITNIGWCLTSVSMAFVTTYTSVHLFRYGMTPTSQSEMNFKCDKIICGSVYGDHDQNNTALMAFQAKLEELVKDEKNRVEVEN